MASDPYNKTALRSGKLRAAQPDPLRNPDASSPISLPEQEMLFSFDADGNATPPKRSIPKPAGPGKN